jgi:hypothetical protein
MALARLPQQGVAQEAGLVSLVQRQLEFDFFGQWTTLPPPPARGRG